MPRVSPFRASAVTDEQLCQCDNFLQDPTGISYTESSNRNRACSIRSNA